MKYDNAMEYYKDEATSAREIAERKFLANDIAGAKKFAMKAQFLYPELDGIAQMVATFVVHLSAQNKTFGAIDYYQVLGLNPEADEETARKRYKELAKMIHPDKNKSVGGEEAFKFLSQAWQVVSDKAKRDEYDLKRNVGFYKGGEASSSRSKASGNKTKGKSSMKDTKQASEASAAAASTSTSAYKTSTDGTFWTVCPTCGTQYEYLRVYVNKKLLCPKCGKPFIAVEIDSPDLSSTRKTFHEHSFDSISHPTEGRKTSVPGRDNNEMCIVNNSVHAAQTGSQKDEVVSNKRVADVSSTISLKRRKVMESTVAVGANDASCSAAENVGVKNFSEDELKDLLKKKAKEAIMRKLQN